MRQLFMKIIFVGFPFLLGVVGYWISFDHNMNDALYSAIRLYGLNVDTAEMNIFLEIARWTAPAATLTSFYWASSYIRNYLKIKTLSLFCENSCAIYGKTPEALLFYENEGLKKASFFSQQEPRFRAKYHVIFGDNDIENIKLYQRIKGKYKKAHVVMEISHFKRESLSDLTLQTFNLNELIARVYWKKNPLLNLAVKEQVNCKKHVGIIGPTALKNELLTFALLLNVYSPNQSVTYHLFGDDQVYKKLHPQLHEIKEDQVFFHKDEWIDKLEILKQLDRIILCGNQEEELLCLKDLMSLNIIEPCKIHILTRLGKEIYSFFNEKELNFFHVFSEVCNRNIIINNELNNEAEKIHKAYFEKEKMKGKNPESWIDLNWFKRYSNIMKAEHNETMAKLRGLGFSKVFLDEVEHLRWMRYHYLNNWQHGKEKSHEKKTHPCLIPYNLLPEKEKKKLLTEPE